MARQRGADMIYEVADLFRSRCLTEGSSLLWPNEHAWTPENISALLDAFIGHPDIGKRSFLEKWHDQLAQQPESVHRVAADTFALYFLFLSTAKPETKLERVETVINWKLANQQPDLALLKQAFAGGIGGAGTLYSTAMPAQLAFFLEFARDALSQGADVADPVVCKRLADNAEKKVRQSRGARHILLHLLFPDQFERIASEEHKRLIVEAFRGKAGGAEDVDDALGNIRRALTAQFGRTDLDFYDDDIRPMWQGGEPSREPRWWIEKTLVKNRPDREAGELALGNALWSPKAGKGGADIYRFMREVEVADVILHLTDDTAFTGISRAASTAGDLVGPAGTEWGGRPCHRIRLRDFERLNPPLSRSDFFASPFKERLVALLDSGASNLFYNHEANLNQGHYLTPAPSELVAILNDAYKQRAGRPISTLIGGREAPAGRLEEGRTLLVGAAGTPNAGAIDMAGEARLVKDQGRLAVWWSFPATGDKEQAIADWPYLYLYQRQPLQQITHRYHFVEHETSKGDAGILCPWPEYAEEQYRDKTRAGERPDEVFKTWFLVDRVEELDPPIALAELEKADGTPPVPGALRGGFGLWRLKEAATPSDPLGELAQELLLDRDYLATIEKLLKDKGQVIFYGPPGTGKTYVARELARLYAGGGGQVEIVQFHPSYAYEDFVEGYRPRDAGRFALVDGPLKRIARTARENPLTRHVLVIDEINRGNVAKVLGELYFLLEYRSEKCDLQYSEKPFDLPDNLWIIATMNTADRSIALVDAALRRRFYFVPFFPSEPPVRDVLRRWLRLHKPELAWVADVVDEANRRLEDEDAAIGPSYFLKPDLTEEWVGIIWKHAILPYVAERLYGETERLGDFDLGLLRAGRGSQAEAQGEEEIAPPDAL